MQRGQHSLFSFFQSSPQTPKAKANEINSQSPLLSPSQKKPHLTFDSLKSKLLRPQKTQDGVGRSTLDFRTPSKNENQDAFSPDRENACKSSIKLNKELEEEVDDRIRPSHALDSSVHGIKRIREEHKNSDIDDGSRLIKRKKLLEALGEGEEQKGLWEEAKAKFEWLSPTKIRDANGRKPGDPFYDKRTLQIPSSVLSKMSASQKQYWETKSKYMDTILFFKVGKFYELYELDAEIGHKELNWKMTVSGVGKCRQVGVPESGIEEAVQKLLARGYKVGRMEQVETAEQAKAKRGPSAMVERKLIQVSTPSTVTDENMKPDAIHLLALQEECNETEETINGSGKAEKVSIGFAFVDAAAGRFYVGSIRDDSARSALGALLSQVAPSEVLYEVGGLSDETAKALRRYSSQGFSSLEVTALQPGVEFLDAASAINTMETHKCFSDSICDGLSQSSQRRRWLQVLKSVDHVNPAASALGALASHLIRMKLKDILQKGHLASYEVYEGSLRLDGQTISNLEIFQNNANGGKTGTLFSLLDNCSTPFGKRVLRRWICHPLQNVREINERLDAVGDLMNHPEHVSVLRSGLRKLPDLERLLSRICSLTNSSEVISIPLLSNRLQRQKVQAFCSLIKGLVSGCNLLKSVCEDVENKVQSTLLLEVSDLKCIGESTNLLMSMATYVEQLFPHANFPQAKQNKPPIDEKDARILDDLILEFSQHSQSWQLIIENLGKLDVLMSYTVSTVGTAGPTCRPTFVSSFSNNTGGSILDIKQLWHPFAMGSGFFVKNDIKLGASSTCGRAMLLTGPNMGGKSTLLRATCIAIIMAQMGCYVPAESCTLSPVDTIFTRLGASDRIMSGESTFMVECAEASSVLRYATPNSLVILDELGRGTSTFDGYAIAYSVFRHLVDSVDCRLLFATHYHPLTKEFEAHPSVSLQHMASAFEGSQSLGREKGLVFLYKLSPGASPDSYGLHVASLAGLPQTVIRKAEKARSIIHTKLSSSFQSNAHRVHLSHVHEQWMKSIIAASNIPESPGSSEDMDDRYDMLLCVWHELQRFLNKSS